MIKLKPETTVCDDELQSFVAVALAEQAGPRAGLVRVDRQPCAYCSSFAIEELTAHLEDGTALKLVFKNLGPHSLSDHGRAMRTESMFRSDREAFVYQSVLPEAGLTTARCYGALVDARRGRYWLLLEYVRGTPLWQIGTFSEWTRTARCLADAHVRLLSARERHGNRAELARFDRQLLENWMDRALRVLRARPGAGTPCETELQHLEAQCRWAIDQSQQLAPTIIHGEFYASNVLVDLDARPARICPIDWETAGIGCGLFDLAALVGGNWSEREKKRLADEYFESLEKTSLHVPEPRRMEALRCCRLLMAMKWIGWSPHWDPPPEHRHDWLSEAMQLADAACHDRHTLNEINQLQA